MTKLSNWKLAHKLQQSNKKGIITGLVIAVVILTLIVVAIVKIQWIKKQLGVGQDDFDFEDDFDLEFDEDGGVYTSESDFV